MNDTNKTKLMNCPFCNCDTIHKIFKEGNNLYYECKIHNKQKEVNKNE